MSDHPAKLGHIALRGGTVTGIAQVLKIGIQFLSVIIMARLLMPEDFGLVAAITPLIAFVGLFQNLGLQQAVIQRKTINQSQLNQVFWVTGLVGIVSVIVVSALSPAIAAFYGDPRILWLTLGAALPLLLGSLSSMPLSLLTRNMQFSRLAFTDVAAAAAGLVGAAAAAYAGLGYWSLLLGTAITSCVTLLFAWLASGWKPEWPNLKLERDILSFGANLTGFNFVNFFSRNLDNVLIGKFSGTIELGYYDRAYKLLLFPLRNINQPLTRLMIPILSRVQDDKARFRLIYLKTCWLLAFVTIPGVAALVMTSQEVVTLLFGERWLPSAPIFVWLGLAGLMQPVTSTSGWIFVCQGKTKTMLHWGVYSALVTTIAFVIGLQWGAVGVAAAYAISGYVARLPVLAFLVNRIGPVTAADFILVQATFIVSSLVAWILFQELPSLFTEHSNLVSILCAVFLSYIIAFGFALVTPPARRAMLSILVTVKDSMEQKVVSATGAG